MSIDGRMRCANGRTLGRVKYAERCDTTDVYRKLNNTHTLMLLWVPRTLCLSRAVPCHGDKSKEARVVSCLLKCLLGHNRHMLSRALASLPCFSHGGVVAFRQESCCSRSYSCSSHDKKQLQPLVSAIKYPYPCHAHAYHGHRPTTPQGCTLQKR